MKYCIICDAPLCNYTFCAACGEPVMGVCEGDFLEVLNFIEDWPEDGVLHLIAMLEEKYQ